MASIRQTVQFSDGVFDFDVSTGLNNAGRNVIWVAIKLPENEVYRPAIEMDLDVLDYWGDVNTNFRALKRK